MAKNIGGNINVTDEADVLGAISVDSTTSATLLSAQVNPEVARVKVVVHNDGNQALWVKLQAAFIDNDKKGIRVPAGEGAVIIEGSDIYTGEISGIMDSGGARNVFVTWF